MRVLSHLLVLVFVIGGISSVRAEVAGIQLGIQIQQDQQMLHIRPMVQVDHDQQVHYELTAKTEGGSNRAQSTQSGVFLAHNGNQFMNNTLMVRVPSVGTSWVVVLDVWGHDQMHTHVVRRVHIDALGKIVIT